MELRQFSITGPAGLALSLPTLNGGSPAYALAGAAVVVLPYAFRLLPYAFALYMLRRGKPFTVEDHGVKISSDGREVDPNTCSPASPNRARLLDDPTEARGTFMLTSRDTFVTFRAFALPVDRKIDLVQCSACAALLPKKDQRDHKRHHELVIGIARKAGY
jgi:hypothetical protein